MLKALLKKQFLELNSFYFQNRKTGKRRSAGSTVGMIILFVLIFASLGFTFFGVSSMLADAFIPLKLDWLFFAMMAMSAIALGTFGSVFTTYAGLYKAKDNELLLSMPIPPSKILLARMTGVYIMSLLYTALVWVPACIKYFIAGKLTPLCVINCILQLFVLTLFVTVLTCVLGWVVALISSKLKSKSFVTVILSIAFFGLYYFVSFKINSLLQTVVVNAQAIGGKLKASFYPVYLLGLSCCGKVVPMIICTAVTAALFALMYFILSRSFIKITTTKTADKKAEYKSEQIKTGSVSSALFRKELKRFAASPTYMLNGGLGTVIVLALAVAAVIKADTIRNYMEMVSAEIPFDISPLFPVIGACMICLVLSMDQITAPSVSLEGKNIWILQTLPVEPRDIFNAKRKLHIAVNAPCAVIASIGLGYAVGADFSQIIYMIVLTVADVMFTAALGLFLNLKNPNLTWTNETAPIKQSAAVAIGLFGGWGKALLIGAVAFLLMNKIDMTYYPFACAVVLLLAARYLNRWIDTKGAEIFRYL